MKLWQERLLHPTRFDWKHIVGSRMKRAWYRHVWNPTFGWPVFGLTGENAAWKFNAAMKHEYISLLAKQLNAPSAMFPDGPRPRLEYDDRRGWFDPDEETT